MDLQTYQFMRNPRGATKEVLKEVLQSPSFLIQSSYLKKGDIIRDQSDIGYFLIESVNIGSKEEVEVCGKLIAIDEGKTPVKGFFKNTSFTISSETIRIWEKL